MECFIIRQTPSSPGDPLTPPSCLGRLTGLAFLSEAMNGGACLTERNGFYAPYAAPEHPGVQPSERADLSVLPRKELEDLAWLFREVARTLANRLGEDSTTSSRPPSSDDPYRRGRETASLRPVRTTMTAKARRQAHRRARTRHQRSRPASGLACLGTGAGSRSW